MVRYTRGQPFLWNVTWGGSKLVNKNNAASQDFDPASRSATNMVELNGPDSFIAAYGSYEPVDDSPVLPKTIRANIASGRLVAWGLDLPLPFIAGTGLFDVLYIDDSLRIFRSSNRFAVQIRKDAL
ncbi:hypothetical protein HYH03_015228 [Edaphochlamys debaryana]|uniref:Uncharacterized protein n=1 Tax=Edaphochlamys debaryana TaxID=47281 RepID=A0A835XMF4_9CHLO|nr:hypothetical protein HYH03_015228 [Edaphochlamys debaryana]|eukprot:KAG2486135.1 hypothetical protein HYH03_015228 [Edaphochlamys debaryana]